MRRLCASGRWPRDSTIDITITEQKKRKKKARRLGLFAKQQLASHIARSVTSRLRFFTYTGCRVLLPTDLSKPVCPSLCILLFACRHRVKTGPIAHFPFVVSLSVSLPLGHSRNPSILIAYSCCVKVFVTFIVPESSLLW